MCAVITVMARRLFTSSVSNVLSRPLSGLVMQISAQSNNSHHEGLEHGPALCHIPACLYLHTCTDPWQVAMTGCRTAVTRSGRIRTWSCSQERPAELSLLLFHKVICRQKYFNLHKNLSRLKTKKESLVVLVANILTSICSFPIRSYKRCKTECGSSLIV